MLRYGSIALLTLGILSLSSSARAMDESQLQACSQISFPNQIDLLQPIPSQWIACLPSLSPVANNANRIASRMNSVLNRLPDIGNEGDSTVERVVYNISLQQFEIGGRIRARQVTDVRVPDVRRERKCVPKPWPLDGEWCENVVVDLGTKVERVITYSGTCNYTYAQNVVNGRIGGSTGCGGGLVGVKIRFDALASILQGQLPSLSEVIRTVDFRTPILRDASRDTYETEISKITAENPGARIYFSSPPFVRWASAEELAGYGLLEVFSLGSATPLLMQKIEGQLRTEGVTFTAWATSNAIQMGTEQLINLFNDPNSVNIPNLRPRLKLINIPIAWNKCLSSGPCTGEINKPRLGFAIIFKPATQNSDPPVQSSSSQPQNSGSLNGSPNPVNTAAACSSTYDPRPYRPGTSGWTGRIGKLAFNNGIGSAVKVTLYHPDAPDRAFNSWVVQPGQNLFFGEENYGMDWGIQVDGSPICIVGLVSDWNFFNGSQIFQTWVERIR